MSDGIDVAAVPEVRRVRVFVPARDHAVSVEFYEAIGWTKQWTDGMGLAILELAGFQIMVQDFYVRDWAENFVMTIEVADVHAWHARISATLATGRFDPARIGPVRDETWGATVAPVWDPTGVLLHYTQLGER